MRFFFCRPALLMLSLALLFAANPALSVQSDEAAFAARYPAGSIQTVELARQALQDVDLERKNVHEDFLDEKDICLRKFFVTSCLDKAKEQKRKALNTIRSVEVEANAYLRKEKAAERDRNVAERMRKAEAAESSGGKVIIPLPEAPREAQPGKATGP